MQVFCSDCETWSDLEPGEEYCPECGAYLFDNDHGNYEEHDNESSLDD